jgi:hypothetical protein
VFYNAENAVWRVWRQQNNLPASATAADVEGKVGDGRPVRRRRLNENGEFFAISLSSF